MESNNFNTLMAESKMNGTISLEKIGSFSKYDIPAIQSNIQLLGIYPKEMKTCSEKDLHVNVHSKFICYSQKMEPIQMSVSCCRASHCMGVATKES